MQVESPIEERLRELESQDGLRRTKAWLAKRIGSDPASVSLWIHGRRAIPDHQRRAIAIALGMPIDDVRGRVTSTQVAA